MGNSQNESTYPIFNGKYELIKLIGSGQSAHVYHSWSIEDPKLEVAIKITKKVKNNEY